MSNHVTLVVAVALRAFLRAISNETDRRFCSNTRVCLLQSLISTLQLSS